MCTRLTTCQWHSRTEYQELFVSPKKEHTNFRSPIESRDEVRRDFIFGCIRGRSQITQFQTIFCFIHEHIIGLDICMNELTFLKERESLHELLRIRAHRFDVESGFFSILFDDLSQIHAYC